jgi:hypothetical protein
VTENSAQSKFIAGLRAFAEKEAAKNPSLGKLRLLSKALVDEIRKRLELGATRPTVGACLLTDNNVRMISPETQGGSDESEIFATLNRLATAGQITGGACATIVQRPLVANGPEISFIDIHSELVEGVALRASVPADPSILEEGIPGVKGPALPFYGKKTEPRIFSKHPEI